MTLTSTIRCDLCGKTETWPKAGLFGLEEDNWFRYVPDVNAPDRHCCSLACWLKHRETATKSTEGTGL